MKALLKFAAPLSLLAIGACAPAGFETKVSRFQAMPAPHGQTFTIAPTDPRMAGSLEFATYANLVAGKLTALGYNRADTPASATLNVLLDYGVDRGQVRRRIDPASPFYSPFGWGGMGYYGRYPGWGWGGYYPGRFYGRHGWMPGFYDPFMFDDFDRVEEYTVYNSGLNLKIEDRATHRPVFEGKAEAMSTTNELTRLVPNLVEAMFTGFPGNSGETVRITVAPPPKQTGRR